MFKLERCEEQMLKMYRTDNETNITMQTATYIKGNWINLIDPTEKEIQEVCSTININEEFIRYALDYEEKARIDIEDDGTILFIIDVPIMEEEIVHNTKIYSTMPIGVIFVRDEYFITVSLKENELINHMLKLKNIQTYKKSRLLLQMFYANAENFLVKLKNLNKETEVAESVLKKSMQNKELLKMLNLKKGLVYLATSLKSNEVVMERTLRGNLIKLYEEDEDLLEDAIIENKQAIEMSKIYSDILTGTLEAYASIISNNLNGVMQVLTSLTIILAIPTMISSYFGMNVPVPLTENPWGFTIIIICSIVIGIVASWVLKKKGMLG